MTSRPSFLLPSGWPTSTDQHHAHQQHQHQYHAHLICSSTAPGRAVADAHLAACAAAGLALAAGRAEAAPGQWSFTLGPLPGIGLADQLWVARHLLARVAAAAGLAACVDALPAPVLGASPDAAPTRLAAAAALGFVGNGAFFKFSTAATRGGRCGPAGGVGAGIPPASPPLAGPATPPGCGEGVAAPLAAACQEDEEAHRQQKQKHPAASPPPPGPAWAAIEATVARLRSTHAAHVLVYGPGAAARLALVGGRPDLAAAAVAAVGGGGACEAAAAAAIPPFSAGLEDRGASLRVPAAIAVHGRGHVEDRRPAGGADPYLVVSALLCSALAGTGAGPLRGGATAAAAAAGAPPPPLVEAFDESSAEDDATAAAAAAAALSGGDDDMFDDSEEEDDDDDDDNDGAGGDDADLFPDDGGDEDEEAGAGGPAHPPHHHHPAAALADDAEAGDEAHSRPARPSLRFAAATALFEFGAAPSWPAVLPCAPGASAFGG